MPFQGVVNLTPAPAVEGDFASSNPRASVLAGPGGFVSGPANAVGGLGGVVVGRFAWTNQSGDVAADNAGTIATTYGNGATAPAGFIHREQQALITQYLAETSMVVPTGFAVTIMRGGDYWAKNAGGGQSQIGQAVYARYSDGAVFVGAVPAGSTATGSMGSTDTGAIGATFTATAAGNQLTVSAVTGVISVGDTINGTNIPAGTTILAQVSGTTGGAGVYTTSVVTTAAAATVTSFGNTLVVSAATGLISIGDTFSGGAGSPVGATIVSQVSGTTGGAGTYKLSAPATAYVASGTVTTYGTTLNVTAVTGSLPLGAAVTGTGIPAGATIASQVSGATGGVGVYTLDYPATAYAASTALTVPGGVLTTWTVGSIGNVGELIKISSVAQF